MKGNIQIKGIVEIRNGNTVIKGENKFVQTLLQHILNFIAMGSVSVVGEAITGPAAIATPTYVMYIGTNTTTATVYNTTALTSPIGGAPGTAPNSINANTSNPSNGVFNIIITATWNAGTVAGTVGEMALYMTLLPAGNLRGFGWTNNLAPTTAVLASRFAAADGAFTPFLINAANPLTIIWTIQLSFV